MGKQTNIRLRCTVENIIYYQWKDIDCIRTVPEKVRQTAPTKREAQNFGMAVKKAAAARSLFRELLQRVAAGRDIINATNNAFRKWLYTQPLDEKMPVDDLSFFNGLSFNGAVDFETVMKVKVGISRGENGDVKVQWPACKTVEAMRVPDETRQIVIKYLAATIDMQQAGIYHCTEAAFAMPYNKEEQPAKEIVLKNVTAPGCLSLVAVAIYYYKDNLQNNPVNILRWKPSGICVSFYN